MPACARPGVYVPRQTHDCDAAVLVPPPGQVLQVIFVQELSSALSRGLDMFFISAPDAEIDERDTVPTPRQLAVHQ